MRSVVTILAAWRRRVRHTAVVGVCLLVTCDRSDRVTGPLASISDGSHESGNRNFFFLPPLVVNPSGSVGYEPLAFDPTVQPTVEICRLDGSTCAMTQPDGFPLVYTMVSGPGSETVRLVESEQHFIANWRAADFQLDPASNYRITVLVRGAPLGYADVDVVSNGRELRSVDSHEFIALLEGRTLPIKFRIERGAITSIDVIETVIVADHTNLLAPVLVAVQEAINVHDDLTALPSVTVAVTENVTTSDHVAVLPPVTVSVSELISISDQLAVLPPVKIDITESVAVADQNRVLPPLSISIVETITVTDVSHVSN